MIDDEAAYRALKSHDPRFDGVFFVGVASTGIYCRPICPARTPQRRHCRFFANAGAAEKSGFRPCLRCRPELAPGLAPVDRAQRIADLVIQRIDEGLDGEDASLEKIAAQFSMSSRQLRRIVRSELGVSPVELRQTRRLLLAKQLLTETTWPVTQVAFASGFASLRRFNEAFRTHYRLAPTRLRRETSPRPGSVGETARLQMAYRPPYDWEAMLEFLRGRCIRAVECVTADAYARTVRLGSQRGWIRVSHAANAHALVVEFTTGLSAALPMLLRRLRHLFDLAARPDLIAEHLGKDRWLQASVKRSPGLRVPGAFDGLEMAVRAILGQQVTVKAATTLAGRFADAFGEKIGTPHAGLERLSPLASCVAAATVHDLVPLGIIETRARTILALARAFQTGALRLEAGVEPELTMAELLAVPGIGPWTAQYLAMRGLRWPDAFPKEDIAVRKGLGGVTAKRADELSQAWRPWRSYAVMHLWRCGL